MVKNKKLLLLLPLLLVVALLVNLGSIMEVARGERSLRSIVYGLTKPSEDAALQGWKVPPDSGNPKARVTIEVFLRGGDPCHTDTLFLGQALATVDPQRLRVKYVDSNLGQVATDRREKLKLGCDQGVAVGGKTEFKIPDPTAPGGKRTVFTAHQKNRQEMATGSLQPILDQELRAVYKGKGLSLTREQFDAKIAAEAKRLREVALMEAKAKQGTKQ